MPYQSSSVSSQRFTTSGQLPVAPTDAQVPTRRFPPRPGRVAAHSLVISM